MGRRANSTRWHRCVNPRSALSGARPGRSDVWFLAALCIAVLINQTAWADARGRAAIDAQDRPHISSAPQHSEPGGASALMRAARSGDTEAVHALLAGGAKVDRRNGNGGTALMYAAVGGHTEIVDLLIRHGADVDARGTNGWGALMVACAKGYVPIVERLLAAGADADSSDVYGWTPLMRAIYEQRNAVVRELLTESDVDLDAVNDHGSSALHLAAIVGDRDIARALVNRGADMDLADTDGRTAADIAEARGDAGLARLLRSRPPSATMRFRQWAKLLSWAPAPEAPSLPTCWRADWTPSIGT